VSESQSSVESIVLEACIGISRGLVATLLLFRTHGSVRHVPARTDCCSVVCQVDTLNTSTGVRRGLEFFSGWVMRNQSRFVVALVLGVLSFELLLDLDLIFLAGLLQSAWIFVFQGL